MSRKILMIDDDRMQYRLTQAHFKNFRGEDFTLDWAATYEEGLARLLEGSYAACLLDYQLGERNGLELIRAAVAGGSHTPIVFLTAEASERVDIEAMNAGALDYLVKGEISSRTLERSLRYALKLGDTLEALRKLATHDQLTSLLNRREFDRYIGKTGEGFQGLKNVRMDPLEEESGFIHVNYFDTDFPEDVTKTSIHDLRKGAHPFKVGASRGASRGGGKWSMQFARNGR